MRMARIKITVYILCSVILAGIGWHVIYKGFKFYDTNCNI